MLDSIGGGARTIFELGDEIRDGLIGALLGRCSDGPYAAESGTEFDEQRWKM